MRYDRRLFLKENVTEVPLREMPTIDVPFHLVAVDLIGSITPVSDKENRYNLIHVADTLRRTQSKLPWLIPWNSVKSDLGCTLRIYSDNVTLMSQKPCQHNNTYDCNSYKCDILFNNKYTSFILLIKFFR